MKTKRKDKSNNKVKNISNFNKLFFRLIKISCNQKARLKTKKTAFDHKNEINTFGFTLITDK